MHTMFSGFGNGFRQWHAFAFLGGRRKLAFVRAPFLDYGADHLLRAKRLAAFGDGRDVNYLVIYHYAQFEIVKKRKFHFCSLDFRKPVNRTSATVSIVSEMSALGQKRTSEYVQ